MRRALVRFTRSHSDDDELVFSKAGPYCDVEPFFKQMKAEFESLFNADQMTLTLGELNPLCSDGDSYRLYCMIHAAWNETAAQLADRLQKAYDDDGVAGWFQIIWLEEPK